MRRLALAVLAFAALLAHGFDPVVPGQALRFPRDHGAHPGHRIEWWYVTGNLDSERGPLGFQVTFFRIRNPGAEGNPSRFSPRQILFAHAALADPGRNRFLHDQRVGRALPGLVEARVDDAGVRIDDWTFAREDGRYRTRIAAEGFALELAMAPTQPVLLEGDRGFSRKGPLATQASYYYSEPHLRVDGRVELKGETLAVRGVAWLDHEWSSEMIAPEAAGWDWLGANLDDGGALMAFRMRAKDGSVLWAAATYRPRDGPPVTFAPQAVAFSVRRTWRSPRTGTEYPVAMDIRVGDRTYRVEPLMDDQELDARASTGTLYWEGAVRIEGPGNARGRGYLELTGYAERVPF
jgi:predicted secreted hydrolase